MKDVTLRAVGRDDHEFLRRMCYEAVYSRNPAPPPLDEAMAQPFLSRYFENWGRYGDGGVLAVGPNGETLGAAWYRLFPADKPSFGWVAEDIPELAIAVIPSIRGSGLGERLLQALIDSARTTGFRALSLSVEDGNRSVNLYNRMGFARSYRDESEKAWTMMLQLRP